MPLAVAQELGLPLDIINVDGCAIAHGHPIGATEAILTTRLGHAMKRDGVPGAAAHGLALHLAAFSQAMPSTMTTLTMAAPDRALRAAWYSGLS